MEDFIKEGDTVYLTGIGSSESHARYLEAMINKYLKVNCKFVSIMEFYQQSFQIKGKLIIFSQGISPNTHMIFKR